MPSRRVEEARRRGVGRLTFGDMRAVRVFLASFLVLFLEVALIRWMPAYIRLLSYFSNFILLASFLGIGVGCLLAPRRTRLFVWFPLLQFAVVAVVYFFRLEVVVPSSGDIFFSSGTPQNASRTVSYAMTPDTLIRFPTRIWGSTPLRRNALSAQSRKTSVNVWSG